MNAVTPPSRVALWSSWGRGEPTSAMASIAAQQTVIAAHRYLAFLDLERRYLVHEMYPEHRRDDGFFVPVDAAVNLLVRDVSPIARAAKVLGFLGVDPYHYDAWVDFIGVNLTQIPIIGTAGDEKNPGKIDWSKLRKRR